MMVDVRDYKTMNGGVDWGRYHAEQEAAGERCTDCGALIFSPLAGLFGAKREPGPRKCYDCNQLDTNKEESVWHEKYVRCPKCGHQEDVFDGDNYAVYEDGEHSFMCGECDHDYTIITHVSHEFESPVMEVQNAED